MRPDRCSCGVAAGAGCDASGATRSAGHHEPDRRAAPTAPRRRPRANSRSEERQLDEGTSVGASASSLRKGPAAKKGRAPRLRIATYIGNEKAGAKRPLHRIPSLFQKFRCRSSSARPDPGVLRERVSRLGNVRRKSTAAATTVRSRIAVITIADAATENYPEDRPDDRASTVTGARIRSTASMTMGPFTAVRIRGRRRGARNGRRCRIRCRLGRRRWILLHHFSLRLLGVRDDRRFGRRLHRRMLRPHRLRTSALFQCRRRRWSTRLRDFGEREARRPLLRCQVEPGRRRELQISFEIVAHRAIRRRRTPPACRDDNGRQPDREHRRSQDRTHSMPPSKP
jgi:hypothetical protein